jgi:type IV secretion system protein VirB8
MSAPDQTRADYYAAAQSWAQDREAARRRSARLAWSVAGLACAVAGLEALALASLAPLKTAVPYTLLVDSHTGYAQMVEGTQVPSIQPDAALEQSLLAQYVVAREGYSAGSLPEAYRKVALWSGGMARRDYLAQMASSNPSSPIAVYGRNRQMSVQVASVSPLGKGRAMLRFSTRLDGENPQPWVAIIRYHFATPPAGLNDRLLNPLGLQVTEYHRDQEAPIVAAQR